MLMDSWFLYMGHVDLGPPHSILRTWTNWNTLENRVYKGDTTATQFNVKKFMGIVAQLFNPWAPWSSTWSLIWKDNLPHYHNKLDQQLFVGMKTVVHNLWLKFMRVVTARLHEKPQTMLALSWCCKKSCKSQHFSHTFSTKWSYSLWLKSGTKTQGASSPILSRSTSTFQGNFIIAPNSTRFPSSSFSTQLAAPSFNSEKNGMQGHDSPSKLPHTYDPYSLEDFSPPQHSVSAPLSPPGKYTTHTYDPRSWPNMDFPNDPQNLYVKKRRLAGPVRARGNTRFHKQFRYFLFSSREDVGGLHVPISDAMSVKVLPPYCNSHNQPQTVDNCYQPQTFYQLLKNCLYSYKYLLPPECELR